ncbi:MAG: hypothetical protein ABSC38_06960 [Verrucomicrobiia bacterium]|jgi:hypothetical protein
MSFDMQRILASKRAMRQNLAALPVAEKLRLLDDLRERELTLRRSAPLATSNVVREQRSAYRPAKPGN